MFLRRLFSSQFINVNKYLQNIFNIFTSSLIKYIYATFLQGEKFNIDHNQVQVSPTQFRFANVTPFRIELPRPGLHRDPYPHPPPSRQVVSVSRLYLRDVYQYSRRGFLDYSDVVPLPVLVLLFGSEHASLEGHDNVTVHHGDPELLIL